MAELVDFGSLPPEEQAVVLNAIQASQGGEGGEGVFATPPSQILPETKFLKATPVIFKLTREEITSLCQENIKGYKKGGWTVEAATELADTGCLIASKKGNKGKEDNRFGYAKRKHKSTGKTEHYLHHIGYLAGDDFEAVGKTTVMHFLKQGYEFSHLCHAPGCIKPDHVVLEPAASNRLRSMCKGWTWVKCPQDGTLFSPCPHVPQCILPMDPDEWGWGLK